MFSHVHFHFLHIVVGPLQNNLVYSVKSKYFFKFDIIHNNTKEKCERFLYLTRLMIILV